MTHIVLCNPHVIYHSGVVSQRLRRTAWLVGAVIVAVVTVHVPLPQLSPCLLLWTAAAVAVAVVSGQRRLLAMLLVMPVILVMAVSVTFGATTRRRSTFAASAHSCLGVVHGLKIVIVVSVDDVALWHHLQVGSDAVVTGALVVAEVDDAAFVDSLVRGFDPGEAEFMGDVASYNFHNLANTQDEERQKSSSCRLMGRNISVQEKLCAK